jgi:hypothetical protein
VGSDPSADDSSLWIIIGASIGGCCLLLLLLLAVLLVRRRRRNEAHSPPQMASPMMSAPVSAAESERSAYQTLPTVDPSSSMYVEMRLPQLPSSLPSLGGPASSVAGGSSDGSVPSSGTSNSAPNYASVNVPRQTIYSMPPSDASESQQPYGMLRLGPPTVPSR